MPNQPAPTVPARRFRFAITVPILLALIIGLAALTALIPAGQYQRVTSATLGIEVPVAGSYVATGGGLLDRIAGSDGLASKAANAFGLALFVLVIGGFFGVLTETGALNTGIARALLRLQGREVWIIPVLMGLFALGGTTFGMAGQTLAFYPLVIPLLMAAGYDALVPVAVILLGAGVGALGSTSNTLSTVIASAAADVAFFDGVLLRLVILVLTSVAAAAFVMRYAARVRADPSRSLVFDHRGANEARFLAAVAGSGTDFTATHKAVLILSGLTLALMIWCGARGGWAMAEISGLFLAAALIIGRVAGLGVARLLGALGRGARGFIGVALIVGLVGGIGVVIDAGRITDTLLHRAEGLVADLQGAVFVIAVYWIEVGMSVLMPSPPDLAVLSMPVLAPFAGSAGVGRSTVVTAFATASGIANLFTPTSAVVIGGLAIGRVPYDRWLRFIWPLLIVLSGLSMAALALEVIRD